MCHKAEIDFTSAAAAAHVEIYNDTLLYSMFDISTHQLVALSTHNIPFIYSGIRGSIAVNKAIFKKGDETSTFSQPQDISELNGNSGVVTY